MANRRVIKGVLGNFLGTYTSRYTDYEGYWLFGLLVEGLGEVEFNLLGGGGGQGSPLEVAERWASLKFADQLRKAGLDISQVRGAWLRIARLPEAFTARCDYAGRERPGYNVNFRAGATMDDGRRCECERILFVAPHDPRVELRRNPADWATGPAVEKSDDSER